MEINGKPWGNQKETIILSLAGVVTPATFEGALGHSECHHETVAAVIRFAPKCIFSNAHFQPFAAVCVRGQAFTMAVAIQMFACRSRLDSMIKTDQKANVPLTIWFQMTSLRSNLRRADAYVHADADFDFIATIGLQQHKLP